jgi:hypothetical protein
MAIDLSGRDTYVSAASVSLFISANHPLIRLAGILPWSLLIDIVAEDLKKRHEKEAGKEEENLSSEHI